MIQPRARKGTLSGQSDVSFTSRKRNFCLANQCSSLCEPTIFGHRLAISQMGVINDCAVRGSAVYIECK